MRPFLRFSRLIPRLTLDVAVILSSIVKIRIELSRL
uniref:Uncharacterized protein n=1 Tax=Salmonella typhi TaxID=90370 RepID=A0A1L4BM51_SALTI|nr:hypothetical protein [Salmonella enterica subsp. enterica serovar Typhi]